MMTLTPRKLLETMDTYRPPLEGRRDKLRLDFNESTTGFPALWPESLSGINPAWVLAYPEYAAFHGELADWLQVTPESLMLVNGSDEALFIIPFTFVEPNIDRALTCTPTFPMIPHTLKLVQSRLSEIPLHQNLTYNIEAIEAELESAQAQGDPYKLVLLASPDNPTGASLDIQTLSGWCKRFKNTLFVMDEAYQEFMPPGSSALPLVAQFSNLVVTRTFSKAWGLAGLRLGYVVAHPNWVSAMLKARSPYSINSLAIETARRILPQASAVLAEGQATLGRKVDLLARLKALGFETLSGGGNFFLLKLGFVAPLFCQYAANQGILVRDRSQHPALKGTLRVSVGTEVENERFLACLQQFFKEGALIFDLDDTLVDTSESFDTVVAFLVKKWSDFPLGKNELTALRAEGGYNDDWVATQELLKRRGVAMSFEVIRQEGQRVYLKLAYETETLLLPEEKLAALKKRFRLLIVTGREQGEYQPIWAERLAPYFEAVVCAGDYPELALKPSPDYLTQTVKHHNLSWACYIGNSVDDMQAAVAAGLLPIGVAQTQSAERLTEAGAKTVVSKISHLAEALIPETPSGLV